MDRPFLRMAFDEARTNSMYYRLLTYDYGNYQLSA